MGLVFLKKSFKFDLDSKNATKDPQKAFNLQEKSVSIGSDKFSILQPEYWQLAVNMLTSSPEILDRTENNFLKLWFAKNDERVG